MRKRANYSQAIALVIVLAFVVLLTIAVVAFFSIATTERRISSSSAHTIIADSLAVSALDVIVGDLKAEIAAGSATTPPSYHLYEPSIPGNIVPQRNKPSGANIPNLVRTSLRDDGPSGVNSAQSPAQTSRASDSNSLDMSLNGRAMTAARWNSHYLITRATNSTTIDPTPVAGFKAPDWVLVTRNGPATQASLGSGASALNNSASTNGNFVVGRYAYAIYDEGGLIDINVAGFPSPSTASQTASKTNLAFADLAAIIGTSAAQTRQIDNIVGWRNYASIRTRSASQPAGSLSSDYSFNSAGANAYYDFALTRNDGFLTTNLQTASGRTDQSFITRQDLLRYRRLTSLSQNVLEQLGTFSRDTNAPTYRPLTVTLINPDFSKVRVTNAFTRFDGTSATVNEPMLKKRFPLTRLVWLTSKGPSASLANTDPIIAQLKANNISDATIAQGTAANIQGCFGLTYNSPGGLWTYNHGAPDRILRLDEITTREPDFFELLQAAIVDGSLGQGTGGGVTGGAATFPDIHMSNKTHHLLSIGAAIIDQVDSDSIPTRIQFKPGTTTWTAYGVESLPYLTQIYPIAGTSPDDSTKWATYLLVQLWNPHRKTTTHPTVRLKLDGGIGLFTGGNGQSYSQNDAFFLAAGEAVTLTAEFSPSPTPLQTNNCALIGSFAALPTPPSTSTNPFVGFRLPDTTLTPAPTGNMPQLDVQLGASNGGSVHPFNVTMEIDAYGTFVPYNHFIGVDDPASWIHDASLAVRDASNRSGTPRNFTAAQLTQIPPSSLIKVDPRATRFGIFQLTVADNRVIQPLWRSSQTSGYGGAIADPGGPVEHAPLRFVGSNPFYPATFAINNAPSTNSRTSYSDNDGVIRPADCVYPDPSVTTNGSSTPYSSAVASQDYRPFIINRPFRSVAELGYAFRDLPWKTLDFFTDQSGDAGLLDVFTITDEPSVVAGRVNLNTQQTPVLQAILSLSNWDELDSTNNIAQTGGGVTTAATMSTKIATATSTTPLLNRADIVLQNGLPLAILPLPSGGTHNQTVKSKREAVARSLTTVGQTRTWNLMIDVVAQSGRYPPTATNLSNFVVEGEKRYWLHVAIDRFTGEIIDQQLEPVYE